MTAPKWATALYSGLVGLLGSLATVLVGNVTVGQMTQGQWVVAALTGLTAAGGALGLTINQVPGHQVVATQPYKGGDVIAGPASAERWETGKPLPATAQVDEIAS